MPLVEKNINSFEIKNDTVVLSEQYLKKQLFMFKKITGTRLSAVVGLNKYNSPFKVWMIMTNLYREAMDPTLAKVGNTIEPLVRNHVINQLNCKFKIYDPAKCNWDVFPENPIFGGIPDGEPINVSGELDYSTNLPMIEIKTTSIDSFVYKKENNELRLQRDKNGLPLIKESGGKRASWYGQNGICIPDDYKLQLGLYLYLRNTTNGLFAIAFLKPEDYARPEDFKIDDHEIALIKMNVKNKSKLFQYIETAQVWYNRHIKTGRSPQMTEDDKSWLQNERAFLSR